MATKTKARQYTLFFETKEQCAAACSAMGLSLRKVTDVDRNHGGNYSRTTGHYGTRVVDSGGTGHVLRVRIRSKLLVDEDVFEGLTEEQREGLDYLEVVPRPDWVVVG